MAPISLDDALNDEAVAENIPSLQEIGGQVKRVKTAIEMSEVTDFPQVNNSVVGERHMVLSEMTLNRIVDAHLPDNNPGQFAAFAAIINASLAAAFGPGGAGTNAIAAAFGPGGAGTNAIAASESRMNARLLNAKPYKGTDPLFPLVGLNGQIPPQFPPTLNEFASMNGQVASALLISYGLPNNGSLTQKRASLAAFCNVNLPH